MWIVKSGTLSHIFYSGGFPKKKIVYTKNGIFFFIPPRETFRSIQFILATNTHTPTHPYKNSPNCFSLEKAWDEGKNVPIYVWNWQSNINNPFGLPSVHTLRHPNAPKSSKSTWDLWKNRHTYAHSHTHILSYSTTSGWLFPFFSALQFISSTRPFIHSSMIKVNRREFGEKFHFFLLRTWSS